MPSVLEPTPPSLARQFYRGRPKAHRSLSQRVIRIALVTVILAFAWSGWYLAKRGFGREWRQRVVEELHKRGVEASVRRLTLDPVRGLIAQDVRIYDFKNRENTLAVISEVALDINYAALLHNQPFLNALDVRGAELTIPNAPGAPPNTPKTQIKELRAHIYFPPEQIYVSQAEGVFCGIRISATGQLIKRNDTSVRRISDETGGNDARPLEHLRECALSSPARARRSGGIAGDRSQFETVRRETLKATTQQGASEMTNLPSRRKGEPDAPDHSCSWSDSAGIFPAGRAGAAKRSRRFTGPETPTRNVSSTRTAFPLLAEVTFNFVLFECSDVIRLGESRRDLPKTA